MIDFQVFFDCCSPINQLTNSTAIPFEKNTTKILHSFGIIWLIHFSVYIFIVVAIAVPKPVSSPTANSVPDHHQLISIDGPTATSNGGDPDSLQYLKPANEDAVAWSEGASDLLF